MLKIVFVFISLITINLVSAQDNPDDILLKNYRPVSKYQIPKSIKTQPAFPIIDMHSHDYAQTEAEVDKWVETMNKMGVEKTIILSKLTGPAFDSVVAVYAKYPEKFEIWCGIDYSGYNSDKNWIKHAIKELERCNKMGAKGIGELGDKGLGLIYSEPVKANGLHIDNPDLKPLWSKCAELGMPVNIHVADPIWMYEKMDSTNDGLMNAYEWRIDMSKKGLLSHQELIQSLANVLKENPKTKFIACHFANCSYDLNLLGSLLDTYPNLWADNSARYAETAPIPRFVKSFYDKYQDRILYGTDMGMDEEMYKVTYRILETEDEHFYAIDQFNYHWPLNGFGLSETVLEKIYRKNAILLKSTK